MNERQLKKEEKPFRIRTYGRTELGLLYSPELSPGAAWLRLRKWIDASPGLGPRLAALGYDARARTWTPAQVAAIVAAIGEP